MRHIWSILCRRSVIDADTNSLSLIDSIEGIDIGLSKEGAKKYEKKNETNFVAPISFEIVSFWTDDDSSTERKENLNLEWHGPNDKKLHEFSYNFIMPKKSSRIRTRIKTNGMPISMPGKYMLKIKLKDQKTKKYKEVSQLPVDVNIKFEKSGK
jgi:hypothetical protein